MQRKKIFNDIWVYLILGVMSIIALFPFYMMFVMGTYYSEDLFHGLPLLVSDYFVENLKTTLDNGLLATYLNSILVSAASVIACLFTSITIGYALAKFTFRGQRAILILVLIGMMLPTQISIIGYIMEMRVAHLTNTLCRLYVSGLPIPSAPFS